MRAIEGGRAALVNALGLCGVDASALPITDEAKLRLGDHARHSEDHAAHIVLSRGGCAGVAGQVALAASALGDLSISRGCGPLQADS